VTRHISSDLSSTHILIPPSKKTESSCTLCESPGHLTCFCSFNHQIFCNTCFSIHVESSFNKSHPTELLWESLSGANPETLEKFKKVEHGKKIIKENLQNIQLFDESLKNEVEIIEKKINDHYDLIENEIEKAQNYLCGLWKELEECKRNTDASELAFMQKHNFQASKGKGIKLFDGNLDDESCLGILKNLSNISVKGETSSKDSILYMIKPRNKEIQILDLNSRNSFKKSLGKLPLKDSGAWCDMPNKKIFYCGGVQGSNFSNESFVIDVRDMSCQVLPVMHKSRALSSIIYYRGKVFVFGGYAGNNLTSCESFEFHSKEWKMISDMPVARSAFSVVEHKGHFYMTGESTAIDRYDPKNDCFHTFVNVLASPCNYSTMATSENSLFIQQNNACIEIDLEKIKVKESHPTPQGKWWSSFPAKVVDGQIYFSRYDDGCLWTFNIKSKAINKLKV
jgi:hypothetical protein